MRQLQGSRVKTTEAQIAQIRTALDIFQIDTGRMPTQSEGLNALVADPGGLPGWNGPYLRDGRMPVDAWGGAFVFENDGETLRVISLGSDGQPGGSGQSADISG